MNSLITQNKTASFVIVTPALGEQLLEMNTHNRSCNRNYVLNLKLAIQSGEWMATNQGIAVSKTGVLLDGQHRLLALKDAGWPAVEILLITGLPDSAQAVIDQGKKRSIADALKLTMNVTLHAHVVAALNVILKDRIGFDPRRTFTVDQVHSAYQEFSEQIPLGMRILGQFAAPIAAAFMITAKRQDVSEQLMAEITDEFLSGVSLERGNPILTLREWCFRLPRGGGTDIQEERFKKTLKALNARINGSKLSRLYA
jgi:hypothetical protein